MRSKWMWTGYFTICVLMGSAIGELLPLKTAAADPPAGKGGGLMGKVENLEQQVMMLSRRISQLEGTMAAGNGLPGEGIGREAYMGLRSQIDQLRQNQSSQAEYLNLTRAQITFLHANLMPNVPMPD